MVTQELIERFFKHKCTGEERKLVLEYFESNPEALSDYIDEHEWHHFNAQEEMQPALSKKIFSDISRSTFGKKRTARTFKRLSIAASLIVTILGTWLLMRQQDNRYGMVALETASVPVSGLVQKVNTTDQVMHVLLEDGSDVALEPGSKIRYYRLFSAEKKRIVYLEGQALFNVAKDKNRPFSVFSDDLVTTALGTSFSVKAFPGNNIIMVLLHEGKVVVRSVESIARKLKKDFFLLPGDQLIYNKSLVTASVRSSGKMNNRITHAIPPQKEKAIVERPDWYKFDGMPLDKVIEQLKVYYDVDIRYISDDIRDKYFTVRIEKRDSLENILNDIALLNDLIVTKKNGVYFLLKK
ncbi:FecR family protein [Niabella aquatica]